MKIIVSSNGIDASLRAATEGARHLRRALKDQRSAAIIVATGTSQIGMLEALVKEPDIAWELVTVFHLDEYIGLSISHAASFRRYLWQRFHRQLPVPPRAFHYIDGNAEPGPECRRLSDLIRPVSIDVCFAGIGENAHLAFNDPPADFEAEEPYRAVKLDAACRHQQFAEGWFDSLDRVPSQAISMSIRQLLKAKTLIVTVEEKRKASAVQQSLEGPVTPDVPASILQQHPDASIFLDSAAASLLVPDESHLALNEK